MNHRSIIAGLMLGACALQPAVAAPADPPRAEARAIYETLVGLDTSVEGKKVPEAAAFLASRFKDAGFGAEDVTLVPVDDTAALIVRYRGDGRGGKPILFLGHIDVVPAHRADWERDPFELIEEDGYFFGRGTLDNKAELALLSATFLDLRKQGFRPTRDLILLFSGDEETSGKTMREVLGKHRALVDAAFALNGDAGHGALAESDGKARSYVMQTAEKSYATFALTARNSGGHSSTPRADNAIWDLADALQRIREHGFPVRSNPTTLAYMKGAGAQTEGTMGQAMVRFAADPGDAAAAATLSKSPSHVGQIRTTCVPTMIEGGHAENALPQSVRATVNCRIFPGVPVAEVRAKLQQLAGDAIEIARTEDHPPSSASPLSAEVSDAVAASVQAIHPGIPVIPWMSAYYTDGMFTREAGIPTYGVASLFIRDSDDFSHGLNERIPVASFYDGLTFWHTMICELAGSCERI